MTVDPTWRDRLLVGAAATAAVYMGVQVANGELFWLGVIGSSLLLFLVSRMQPLSIIAVLLLAVTIGYVIGNRGFAQISPSPTIPLLPAEAVLMVAMPLLLVQCAWRHELPFRRDALSILVMAWVVIGMLRIGFDIRRYGIMALRDFALVYYAAFFVLGQYAARDPRFRRLYVHVLSISSLVLVVVFPLYERFPDFFFSTFVWRGVPVIFYKGDLIVTFIAIGAVLHFVRFEATGRWWHAGAAIGLSLAVVSYNTRAAMLALFVATAWLAIGGRWRFAALQAGAMTAGAALILMFAAVTATPWKRTPLFSVYERVVSMVDPSGLRTYEGETTYSKGDNNLYRAVWWGAVYQQTMEENPYVGVGFGRDLADRFLRLYYPDNDEFNVRSPHNVLLTIFARMGALGLAGFLALIAAIAVRTWRAVRSGAGEAGLWCAVWAMLTSACLGVVLEGPMGAVIFWTALGVANAESPNPAVDGPRGTSEPDVRTDAERDEPVAASV